MDEPRARFWRLDTETIAAVERLPALRVTVAAAGLTADKRFGQHFLFDLNLPRRIARAGGPLDAGEITVTNSCTELCGNIISDPLRQAWFLTTLTSA